MLDMMKICKSVAHAMQYLVLCLAAYEGSVACENAAGLDENGNPIELRIASDDQHIQRTCGRLTADLAGLYQL